MIQALVVAVAAFCVGFVAWASLAIGGRKRCPEIYSAADLKEWSVSEKALVGLLEGRRSMWRPARPCGIFGLGHLRRRVFTSWRVFCGELDAVRWGERSGEAVNDGTNYRDILDEKKAEACPLAITLEAGEAPRLLGRFAKLGEEAPICGISGSFVFGKSQFAVTAVDLEALRWFLRAVKCGELHAELCEEVLLLPSRHVVNVTAIKPAGAKVVPFPGATTEVTQ